MSSAYWLRLLFTALALAAFWAGTTLIAISLLANAPDSQGPNDLTEGAAIMLQLVWPVFLFLTWLFGGIALLFARRLALAALLLFGLIGVYVLVEIVLRFLVIIRPASVLPLRGVDALILLFVMGVLDVAAGYFAWQYILRRV